MISLPATTKNHYLTGMTALNIPSARGKSGDWHFYESFYGRNDESPKIFLAGEGESWNTNSILSDFGIYECSEVLKNLGLNLKSTQKVYAANHFRAILDMLYKSVKNHSYPYHLEIDDWIDEEAEKAKLINLMQRLKLFLDEEECYLLQDWILKQN